MNDEPFTVRPAGQSDVDRIAGLFQLVYGQTSHPCSNPDNIVDAFARGEKWLVCEQGEALIACTALIPHRWNATYEVGRSVTHPAARRQGLGRLIYRDSLRWAVELGEEDFVCGWPRNAEMCRMLCSKTTPPMHLFGHDGGANIANGIREIHAVGIVCTSRPCLRAKPLFGPGCDPFFKDRIDRVRFQDVVATPPTDLVVGPQGDHCYESPYGTRLRYSRLETALGWSVFVASVDAPSDEIDGLLAQFLIDHPQVRYLGCYLLWDKLDVIDSLGLLGFQATAYLPGWCRHDGVRHDCLQLVWLAPGETTVDNEMSDYLYLIRAALAGLTSFSAPTTAEAIRSPAIAG
jgi:hypothetical protein